MAQDMKTLRMKIVSIGAPETGKVVAINTSRNIEVTVLFLHLQSCLIKRYCEKRFVSKYMATLGIDFGVTRYSGHTLTPSVTYKCTVQSKTGWL